MKCNAIDRHGKSVSKSLNNVADSIIINGQLTYYGLNNIANEAARSNGSAYPRYNSIDNMP